MPESVTVSGRLYLGTSGFAYPEWKGTFYPPGFGGRRMLQFYAQRFRTVEVNYTFRRQPAESTLLAWRERTPEGFLFGVKAHRRITHSRRLKDAAGPARDFVESMGILGSRLGPVLFQTPPTMRFDHARLEAFLDGLPPGRRLAFEFRHPSFEDARALLASNRVAWCVAESDRHPFTEASLPSGPFAYLRLRRERYGRVRLAAWAARIRTALDAGTDVFCYFKHEDKGAGPVFAERLGRAVDRLSSPPRSGTARATRSGEGWPASDRPHR